MKIKDYLPPYLFGGDQSWNDAATRCMGKLVKEEGGFFGCGEELFSVYGEQISEQWIKLDKDPDPKHDWREVLSELCVRLWENDKARDPDFNSTARMAQSASVRGDILLIDKFQKGGTPAKSMNLNEALQTQFDSDMHFVPVLGLDVRPDKSMNFHFSYLVFDWDCPNHEPLTDHSSWLEKNATILEEHSLLSQYRAFYTTRGGCRVIYQPERVLTQSEMKEMRMVYTKHMKLAGIEGVDDSCKDVSRLFRLPLVTRDGVVSDPQLNEVTACTVPVALLPKEVKNYRWEEYQDEKGNDKVRKVPIGPQMIADKVFECCGGWPKSVSGQLFYMDATETLQYLDTTTELVVWLGFQLDRLHIHEGSGFLSKQEVFGAIAAQAEKFETVHKYTYSPPYSNVYLLTELPEGSDVGLLDQLLEFFHPDSKIDQTLLKAAFCTPMLNTRSRPVFTIDSSSGRGAGKTSVVDVIGLLYGGTLPISVTDVKKKLSDEAKRVFFYDGARGKRVVLVDNVSGFFGNADFAATITCKELTARRPYAKSMETRNNDITWFITSNDANFDKDYISRSIFIFLTGHPPIVNWENNVNAFVEKHREAILAEIRDLVSSKNTISLPSFTRFAGWEESVLKNVCKGDKEYSAVMKQQTEAKSNNDADLELCDEMEDLLAQNIPQLGVYVPKKELFKAYAETGGELKYQLFRSIIEEGTKTGSVGDLQRSNKYGGKHTKNGKVSWIWTRKTTEIQSGYVVWKMGKFQHVI